MKNFVAMMVGERFEQGTWYVLSPFKDQTTGEVSFDYYPLTKYYEAVNLGLKVEREERLKHQIFSPTVVVGEL